MSEKQKVQSQFKLIVFRVAREKADELDHITIESGYNRRSDFIRDAIEYFISDKIGRTFKFAD